MDTIMGLNVPDKLSDAFIEAVGEGNILRFILNKNLPVDLFELFCFLDQGITADTVTDALGYDFCVRAFADRGLSRLGHVVALPRDRLMCDLELSTGDIAKLEIFLARANLALGADMAVWASYRKMVPETFKLFRTEARTLTELMPGRISSDRYVA